MEQMLQLRQVRRKVNSTGWTMLIYYAIMNEFVMLAMVIDLTIYAVQQMLQSGYVLDFYSMYDLLMERMMDFVTSNGWGYILAILVGTGILLIWKKPRFIRNEVFAKGRKMTFVDFIQLFCAFVSVQMFLQLFATALEWLLNLVGLSAMQALEAASITSTGVSMFLYVTLIGPIAEELLFRGLVLRILRPYGKQMAIFVSALFFGLFHGNIVQSPFAFLLGLVLGYITVEYSIVWAIVLHIINNLVLADLASRAAPLLPEGVMDGILNVFMGAAAIVTVVLLIVRRKEVKAYFTENRLGSLNVRALVSSAPFWIFTALMSVMAMLTITRLQ